MWISLRLYLVGVILRRMENEGDKTGEKMMFLVVWLRVENMRDFGGVHKFSLLSLHTQSLQIGLKMGVKSGQKYLDKIAHIFFLLFFFYLNLAVNMACLPFVFFLLDLTRCWFKIYIYIYIYDDDDVRICDTP